MARVRPAQLQRNMLPASGPVIVAEHNGLPWIDKVFQTNWRKIARAIGIPDNVQNRDSRAGATTDAERKGADIEKLRRKVATLTKSDVVINIVEIRKPELDAQLVAE